ncbi:MAG TPA: 2-oxoacid:acceptor oxidoreductase family protein, partial [Candidatus Polarisedimenticolaceae bacterium]
MKKDAPGVAIVDQQIIEFVSDSGEGAQTAGQLFGTLCAQSGNGVWTVEIIPAEIEPPFRSRQGASGNRIRFATGPVTNMGETADLVVALNEQVLYSRIDVGGLREGTILLLESGWGESPDAAIRAQYAEALADFRKRGYRVHEVPIEAECRKLVPDPKRGRNMWSLGMVCAVYERDLALVDREIERRLGKKGEKVVSANCALVRGGYAWAQENLPFRFRVP